MTRRNVTIKFSKVAGFILVLVIPVFVCGQYSGETVKKDKLLRVLRSKQLQSRDIIKIIQESGVDFQLTPIVENELASAGARPAVIEAVRSNYRYASQTSGKTTPKNTSKKDSLKTGVTSVQQSKPPPPPARDYNSLLEQAIDFYDNKKDRQAANDILQEAVRMQPQNPRAYQLLGFLNLYGAKNFDEAERYWKTAIGYGGGAVLRVVHDHGGVFLTSCQGSLYIARDTVRYESDDNKHTFEAKDADIREIKVNSFFKRMVQLKQGSFKIELRKEAAQDETNFSFAPLSGKTDESKMIIRLIGKKK